MIVLSALRYPLITGASQGIGRVIASKFASMGAKVILNDIPSQEDDLKKFAEEINGKYYLADVSKIDQVEKMMTSIKDDLGGLDVLVNNAGITQDKTLAKMTTEEWQRVIDINLTGVFNCSKAALPLLILNQGNMVNVSSIVGQRGNFGQANYSASKAGIISITQAYSKLLSPYGRVNAISPSAVNAGYWLRAPKDELEEQISSMPNKRLIEPEEIAEVVLKLASPDSKVNGQNIIVDGGKSFS